MDSNKEKQIHIVIGVSAIRTLHTTSRMATGGKRRNLPASAATESF